MSSNPSSRPLPHRAWQRLRIAGPPDWVCDHCLAVAGLASAFCRLAEQNGQLVRHDDVVAGALLHDVGRSITQDVRHASLGAELLRSDGRDEWPASVILMVERHTGAGIDEREAESLGLPVKDYTPRTLGERIVAHADNLYSGPERLTLKQVEAKYRAKKLPQAGARIRRLHAELCEELGTDLEQVAPRAVDVQ